MDAGHFPTYEKIINTTPLPRTRQEKGIFLIEIAFDPLGETHSVGASMRLAFGAFGGVMSVDIGPRTAFKDAATLSALSVALQSMNPPATLNESLERDCWTITLVPGQPTRHAEVQGTLVFDRQDRLSALLAPLSRQR